MGFLKSSIKSVGTLLLADFLFYGVAQSATPIFYERIDYMKKIRSYTSIWSVEKVLYSINDFSKDAVRKGVNLEKWYLDGRFKAVPSINPAEFSINPN